MKSVAANLCVIALAVGVCNAVLECYSCTGQNATCPKVATDSDLAQFEKQVCNGTLAHVCAKYSIDLRNGDSITYRSCEPPYIGGTNDGPEFCSYIKGLFDPLVSGGLIGDVSCTTCGTIECNT